MSPETAILLALAIPLVGAPLIVVFRRVPNRREAVTLVTAALLFLAVARLIPVVMAGGRPAVTLFEILPGLPIAFEVEPLGMVFAAVASFLWIVTSVYSATTRRTRPASTSASRSRSGPPSAPPSPATC
jgi:multicomponent Na+:H+ antiporter subunit D